MPASAARILADRVAETWPATDDLLDGLDCAAARAWTSWPASVPSWAGRGTDLLTIDLPPKPRW